MLYSELAGIAWYALGSAIALLIYWLGQWIYTQGYIRGIEDARK
jgi:hypothetical protein